MPAFVALILQGFVIVLTSVIGQWLFGLGIGIVAYTGIGALISSVTAAVTAASGGVPGELLGFLGLFKLQTGLNIILSACSAKFAMKAAGSATLKQFAITR